MVVLLEYNKIGTVVRDTFIITVKSHLKWSNIINLKHNSYNSCHSMCPLIIEFKQF